MSGILRPHTPAPPSRRGDRRSPGGWFELRTGPSRLARIALPVLSFAVLLGAWTAASVSGQVNPIFLPAPIAVAASAIDLFGSQGFCLDLLVSVYRVAGGFLIAAAVAIPLGVTMGAVPVVRAVVEPFFAFVRYMPAAAFVPLLVLWLGITDAQKFAVIFMGTVFHLTLLILASTLSVPLPLIEAAMMLGARRDQLIGRVIWRAALPAIVDNLRIVLGWAWTYIVVAELVAAQSGVGYVILRASRFLDTATIFVGIVSIGLIGIASDLVFLALSRRCFPYLQVVRP